MTDKWWRVTGAFGLGWFVLFAVGGIILQGEPPPFDQPVAEAREFFAAGGGRYLVGDYIAGLAFVLCFLPFVVGCAACWAGQRGACRSAPVCCWSQG
jgi:hypothetical protein